MEVPLLKGKLKFKEGRSKWKNRFIVFYRPVQFEYHLQLYVLKSEEEFEKNRLSYNGYINQGSGHTSDQTVIKPYDQIFGLECGHKIDKNAHTIILLGRSSVCFVGHHDFPQMMEWSDRLQRELSDVYYHATLCEVSPKPSNDVDDTNGRVRKSITSSTVSSAASSSLSSSNSPGTVVSTNSVLHAGTLHIEKPRVCFVSEPTNGSCKLIGSWDIRSLRHFGTKPNDYFYLEVTEEKKGVIIYTFKSQRVDEICRDVQAVFSDRLPPSLLMNNGSFACIRSKRPPSAKSSPNTSASASVAMKIPPSDSRRSTRRRRRSRDQTLTDIESSKEADPVDEGRSRAGSTCSRRASFNPSTLASGSSSSPPQRRHSNCGSNGGLKCLPGRLSNGVDVLEGIGRLSVDATARKPEPSAEQHWRLQGEDENSAYTVFVPPARMSPTVIRRRESEHSVPEPQRSVSFRLSNLMSRPSLGGSSGQEKRGNFFHRLIHKRRSRSDCDLGGRTEIGSDTPPEQPSLRLAMPPPRSLPPSSVVSSSSNGGSGRVRARVRPRPLPSPGVEDLRLLPGLHLRSHRRPPQRSASGSELTALPTTADYHEFFPVASTTGEQLRHSSTSLSLLTPSSSSSAIPVGQSQAAGNATANEVPLSPIREDLRASASRGTPNVVSVNCLTRRTRSTSTSSGVSCGCGCGTNSSACSSVVFGHLVRLPSTSSTSTAPSPPVQMRRCRLHTQTSTETSHGSLLPLESPPPLHSERSTTAGTGGESTSVASSPDTQPSFFATTDLSEASESCEVSTAATSSSAPCKNSTMTSHLPEVLSLRSAGDLQGCSSCTASLHHYVNMTPSSVPRDRGYVNLDLRGEINFPHNSSPYDPSSTRGSLVSEDSRSVNFAPLDMRPSTKIAMSEGSGPKYLNYAQLQWMPQRPTHLGEGEEAEKEAAGEFEGGKRDGYIEIDPIKTFAVNQVLFTENEGGVGRQPKRHSSMKNGSSRRVPRFRFSSRKSYESTAPS